jgi:hypothetical protein
MERVLIVKLTSSKPVRKFPLFYGTRKYNTVFTIASHLSLFCARSTQPKLPNSLLEDASSWYLVIYTYAF